MPSTIGFALREETGDEFPGYDLVGKPSDAERAAAISCLRVALAATPQADIESALLDVWLLVKTRDAGEENLTAQIAAYARRMVQYPADVVFDTLEAWVKREKFWPAWSEFYEMLERRVKRRRAMLKALEEIG